MLRQITIPQFITKVKVSDKQRARYYKKGSKIPKKYKHHKFKHGYLVGDDGQRIIANPNNVGQPKYEILSGNKLLSGYGSPHIRATLVHELKEFYKPFIIKHVQQHGALTTFPLRIEWEVHTTIEDAPNWDASNLFFYYKYFEDCLHDTFGLTNYSPLIPNDTVCYITHPPGPKIIPIDNWEDRKFVFTFYHDNRNELDRKPWNHTSP